MISDMQNRFTQYCRDHLCFGLPDFSYYKSFALAVLDASFQANANYQSVINVVNSFCCWSCKNGVELKCGLKKNCYSKSEQTNVSDVYCLIQNKGIDDLKQMNSQQIAGRSKAELFADLLKFMIDNKIETYQDYQKKRESIQQGLLRIKGVGKATVCYLAMLSGESDYVKIDRHIKNFVNSAVGKSIDDHSIIKELFINAAKDLSVDHKGLTAKHLDHIAWNYQRNLKTEDK